MTLLEIHDMVGGFPFYAKYGTNEWLILGYGFFQTPEHEGFYYCNPIRQQVVFTISDSSLWEISELQYKQNFVDIIDK